MRVTKMTLEQRIAALKNAIKAMEDAEFVVISARQEHKCKNIPNFIPVAQYAQPGVFDGEIGKVGPTRFVLVAPKIVRFAEYKKTR